MSLAQQAVQILSESRDGFLRSTSNLTEDLSQVTPATGMMSAAQQVAHVARVIDWFLEGAFEPQGFDLNFEAQIAQVLAIDSLAAAREWFDRSYARAIAVLGSKSDAELMHPLPEGEILPGLPRFAILIAITDHTAHHRGALTVYARLHGFTPADPYLSQ